jgi:hypothetical protein
MRVAVFAVFAAKQQPIADRERRTAVIRNAAVAEVIRVLIIQAKNRRLPPPPLRAAESSAFVPQEGQLNKPPGSSGQTQPNAMQNA